MSHFRRRLMMQRKASILPAGYTQLEYIERDEDNQGYIDTGIKMVPTYSMILDFKPLKDITGPNTPAFWGGFYFCLRITSAEYILFPFSSLPVISFINPMTFIYSFYFFNFFNNFIFVIFFFFHKLPFLRGVEIFGNHAQKPELELYFVQLNITKI